MQVVLIESRLREGVEDEYSHVAKAMSELA